MVISIGGKCQENLLDFECEIKDYVVDKVLRANGNLSLVFFAYLLKTYLDVNFGYEAENFTQYEFLESYGAYLELSEDPHFEFTQKRYDYYTEYFAYLDEFEDSINDKLLQVLDNLQNDVGDLVLGSITEGGELLETLLIQLLGHDNFQIRATAIK